jgi:hypothetical protein
MVMEKTAKNKWLVRGAAVLVFMLGFVAGALALNVYRHYERRGNGPQDRAKVFEQTLNQLGLNDDQKSKARQILAETRDKLQAVRKESEPKVVEIRRDADSKLQGIMSADQWQQFQKMREENRGRGRGRGRPDR